MADQLPNKCDLCGLRVLYTFQAAGDTMSSDDAFTKLHSLKKRRIISRVPARVVGSSNVPGDFGSTAFCAVTSKAWQRHTKKCKYWAFRIDGASVADYLSLYHDRRNHVAAIWLGVVAIIITVAVALTEAVV